MTVKFETVVLPVWNLSLLVIKHECKYQENVKIRKELVAYRFQVADHEMFHP